MANTLEQVRANAPITSTPRDAGVEVTIKVRAYDKGLIMINDHVCDEGDWLGASRFILQLLEELKTRLDAR